MIYNEKHGQLGLIHMCIMDIKSEPVFGKHENVEKKEEKACMN